MLFTPKVQSLVYDILPLEEGAGKRCSECGLVRVSTYVGGASLISGLKAREFRSPGHSAKSASGRLQLNTHTPYVLNRASALVTTCP